MDQLLVLLTLPVVTPSITMNKAYKFSQKSTFSNFDQSYRQKYESL
jgi:hypothetical protein